MYWSSSFACNDDDECDDDDDGREDEMQGKSRKAIPTISLAAGKLVVCIYLMAYGRSPVY